MSLMSNASYCCCIVTAVWFSLAQNDATADFQLASAGIDYSIETGSIFRVDPQTEVNLPLIGHSVLRLETVTEAFISQMRPSQPESAEAASSGPLPVSLNAGQNPVSMRGGLAPTVADGADSALDPAIPLASATNEALLRSDESSFSDKLKSETPIVSAAAKVSPFKGILTTSGTPTASSGRTLAATLSMAYSGSRQLAAARAQLRATSELLPQARASMLPSLSGIASLGASRSLDKLNGIQSETNGDTASLGLELGQTLFDGFRTQSNMAAAHAQMLGAEASYAGLQQSVLLTAATAHMNVLRDRKVAALRRANLSFLDEQLRAAKVRFDIGEGTTTDVAQAQSQRALATALLETARADMSASEAAYLEAVGVQPGGLLSASYPKTLIPSSITAAQKSAQSGHPVIRSALFAVDAAASKVGTAESGRLPSLSLTASLKENLSADNKYAPGLPGVSLERRNQASASVGLKLVVPFYAGGKVSSEIRQAKETLGQRRIEVDQARFQVRAAIATAWARLEAARANVKGFRARVEATQIALGGVTEEREIGQRTTLDVLNAQAEVISSEILLVEAERDMIVFAYSLSAAMGRISPEKSGAMAVAVKKRAKSSVE